MDLPLFAPFALESVLAACALIYCLTILCCCSGMCLLSWSSLSNCGQADASDDGPRLVGRSIDALQTFRRFRLATSADAVSPSDRCSCFLVSSSRRVTRPSSSSLLTRRSIPPACSLERGSRRVASPSPLPVLSRGTARLASALVSLANLAWARAPPRRAHAP